MGQFQTDNNRGHRLLSDIPHLLVVILCLARLYFEICPVISILFIFITINCQGNFINSNRLLLRELSITTGFSVDYFVAPISKFDNVLLDAQVQHVTPAHGFLSVC